MPADRTATRLRGILAEYDRVYAPGGLWRSMTERHLQGRDARPRTMFLTMSEVAELQSELFTRIGSPPFTPDLTVGLIRELSVLSALGAWRLTQGVYRIDHTLLAALWATPVSGPLPATLLSNLPQWCVYVETPVGTTHLGQTMHGFWAHLELDTRTGPELRLLPDIQPPQGRIGPWMPIGIPLSGTLQDGLDVYFRNIPGELAAPQYSWTAGAISLLLYLCSAAEYGPHPAPALPVPVLSVPALPTDQVIRRAAHSVTVAPQEWRVGERLGAALRKAGSSAETGTGAARATHLRRGHWTTVWLGPKSALQTAAARWIHPLIIRADREAEDRPVVIHKS